MGSEIGLQPSLYPFKKGLIDRCTTERKNILQGIVHCFSITEGRHKRVDRFATTTNLNPFQHQTRLHIGMQHRSLITGLLKRP